MSAFFEPIANQESLPTIPPIEFTQSVAEIENIINNTLKSNNVNQTSIISNNSSNNNNNTLDLVNIEEPNYDDIINLFNSNTSTFKRDLPIRYSFGNDLTSILFLALTSIFIIIVSISILNFIKSSLLMREYCEFKLKIKKYFIKYIERLFFCFGVLVMIWYSIESSGLINYISWIFDENLLIGSIDINNCRNNNNNNIFYKSKSIIRLPLQMNGNKFLNTSIQILTTFLIYYSFNYIYFLFQSIILNKLENNNNNNNNNSNKHNNISYSTISYIIKQYTLSFNNIKTTDIINKDNNNNNIRKYILKFQNDYIDTVIERMLEIPWITILVFLLISWLSIRLYLDHFEIHQLTGIWSIDKVLYNITYVTFALLLSSSILLVFSISFLNYNNKILNNINNKYQQSQQINQNQQSQSYPQQKPKSKQLSSSSSNTQNNTNSQKSQTANKKKKQVTFSQQQQHSKPSKLSKLKNSIKSNEEVEKEEGENETTTTKTATTTINNIQSTSKLVTTEKRNSKLKQTIEFDILGLIYILKVITIICAMLCIVLFNLSFMINNNKNFGIQGNYNTDLPDVNDNIEDINTIVPANVTSFYDVNIKKSQQQQNNTQINSNATEILSIEENNVTTIIDNSNNSSNNNFEFNYNQTLENNNNNNNNNNFNVKFNIKFIIEEIKIILLKYLKDRNQLILLINILMIIIIIFILNPMIMSILPLLDHISTINNICDNYCCILDDDESLIGDIQSTTTTTTIDNTSENEDNEDGATTSSFNKTVSPIKID
ncbi:hypothetical protein ACTFIU_007428 [Dictyostelium citrinum]